MSNLVSLDSIETLLGSSRQDLDIIEDLNQGQGHGWIRRQMTGLQQKVYAQIL